MESDFSSTNGDVSVGTDVDFQVEIPDEMVVDSEHPPSLCVSVPCNSDHLFDVGNTATCKNLKTPIIFVRLIAREGKKLIHEVQSKSTVYEKYHFCPYHLVIQISSYIIAVFDGLLMIVHN